MIVQYVPAASPHSPASSQENGLEAKSDPSGKGVQKARWATLPPESPRWSRPFLSPGAGWHGEQEMSGPSHAAGHWGISAAAWFCFGLV